MADDEDVDEEAIREDALKQRLLWDDELNLAEDTALEILAAAPILWSSWECDYTAVLYRLLPDGEPQLYVEGGVHTTRTTCWRRWKDVLPHTKGPSSGRGHSSKRRRHA